MSLKKNLSRAGLAGLGIGMLGTLASAQLAAEAPRGLIHAAQGHHGVGVGTVTMPTLDAEGLLVGVLVDEKAGVRYTIESQLTNFVAWTLPGVQTAFGGMYGQVYEVAEGGLVSDAIPRFVGYVEGQWSMEKNLSGSYEAYIYQRSIAGPLSLAGAISGQFRVQEMDEPVPAPKHQWHSALAVKGALGDVLAGKPALDDAASGAASSSPLNGAARKPALDDASSQGKSNKSAFADASNGKGSGGSKSSDDAFKTAASGQFGTARANRFGTPSGSVLELPSLMGAFKAHFKLLE